MKPKLILCLALVLGGHCFAAITYPQAPDGGSEVVIKYLGLQSLKFLKVSRVEDLTIARPFAEYHVTNLTDLSSKNFLVAAKQGVWLYQLAQGTNAVGEVGLMPGRRSGNRLEFEHLSGMGSTHATLDGLRVAERLPQIKNQDYELRRLDIAPMLFHSVWLHGKSDDILIPLPPTFGRWKANEPYSEAQMLALLKPEVEKTRQAWKSFAPK
ncbi:MAG TPA: hypothetical protein VK815_09365 [Candidatus Acidoferrales bacterium]|jgi:hypothetical protein|nr:hypothetical protein [Candidatus Acidoferrales bacterium]